MLVATLGSGGARRRVAPPGWGWGGDGTMGQWWVIKATEVPEVSLSLATRATAAAHRVRRAARATHSTPTCARHPSRAEYIATDPLRHAARASGTRATSTAAARPPVRPRRTRRCTRRACVLWPSTRAVAFETQAKPAAAPRRPATSATSSSGSTAGKRRPVDSARPRERRRALLLRGAGVGGPTRWRRPSGSSPNSSSSSATRREAGGGWACASGANSARREKAFERGCSQTRKQLACDRGSPIIRPRPRQAMLAADTIVALAGAARRREGDVAVGRAGAAQKAAAMPSGGGGGEAAGWGCGCSSRARWTADVAGRGAARRRGRRRAARERSSARPRSTRCSAATARAASPPTRSATAS